MGAKKTKRRNRYKKAQAEAKSLAASVSRPKRKRKRVSEPRIISNTLRKRLRAARRKDSAPAGRASAFARRLAGMRAPGPVVNRLPPPPRAASSAGGCHTGKKGSKRRAKDIEMRAKGNLAYNAYLAKIKERNRKSNAAKAAKLARLRGQ